MKEDKKYKNFVNEDGESWLNFVRKEEPTRRRRKQRKVEGPFEKFGFKQ
jgi:hypothetical protein